MKCRQYFTLFFLVFSLLFCFSHPGLGATAGKVTILLLDRLSSAELSSEAGPFLKKIINESALALITTNTAGTRSAGNTHATLGAGAPAFSDRPGGLGLNDDEKWMGVEAGLLYQQLSGDPAHPTGKVILPRLPEAVRLNFSPIRTAIPCLLGKVLHENGLRTAVLGNSDPAPPEDENPYYTHARFAPWLAADQRGLVDYGDVGPLTLRRGQGLLPWETDYRYLVTKYQEFRGKADFLVLELGDFARLDALSSYLFDRQIAEEKQRLFTRLDEFCQSLWPLLDREQDVVILVAPTPSLTNLKQGAYLTPCLVWGKDFPPGLLSSPTTRRPGLVANIDLASTVFHLFNLKAPAYATGRAMTAGHSGDLSFLLKMETKTKAISLFRRKVLPSMLNSIAFFLPLVLLTIGLLKKMVTPNFSIRTYLWFFTIFLSSIPMALHLASQLPLAAIPWFIGATIVIAIFLTLLSARSGKAFLLPLYLFSVLIPIDLLFNTAMIQASVLGYDPMLGARYYGIGNELAGLFLGSLLGSIIWFNRQNKRFRSPRWVLLPFLVAILIMSVPGFGANFGAGLTATAIAIALAFLSRQTKNTSFHQVLIYLSILILFALVLLIFDYFFSNPEHHSHFGLLLNNIKTRGITAIGEIVRRKLGVNLRLLPSRWTFLLLSAFLTYLVPSFRPSKSGSSPYFLVALIGGGVGFLFNDSGLVFTALFFYPLATTGLLLKLVEQKGKTTGKESITKK